MREYSTISAEGLQSLKEKGITEKDKKQALIILDPAGSHAPLSKLSVMFYIDRRGNFLSNKTKTALIVQELYNSLEKADQKACMSYLMESED